MVQVSFTIETMATTADELTLIPPKSFLSLSVEGKSEDENEMVTEVENFASKITCDVFLLISARNVIGKNVDNWQMIPMVWKMKMRLKPIGL